MILSMCPKNSLTSFISKKKLHYKFPLFTTISSFLTPKGIKCTRADSGYFLIYFYIYIMHLELDSSYKMKWKLKQIGRLSKVLKQFHWARCHHFQWLVFWALSVKLGGAFVIFRNGQTNLHSGHWRENLPFVVQILESRWLLLWWCYRGSVFSIQIFTTRTINHFQMNGA